MKGNAALATVLVIFSALALQLSTAAAFEPSDILLPGGPNLGVWEGRILPMLWEHVEAGCSNDARIWWRMAFHDCGTFDKNKNVGGCDGSLQFELNRIENGGMAGTIGFYQSIIDSLDGTDYDLDIMPRPSMADVIVAGGLLGLKACGGPVVRFSPGRRDASGPNGEGLIPLLSHDIKAILKMMDRATFTPRESVVLIGAGHTVSAKSGGRFPAGLDATPDDFDNKFFQELRANNTGNKLVTDTAMLKEFTLRQWINVFARDEPEFIRQSVIVITKMINLRPRSSDDAKYDANKKSSS